MLLAIDHASAATHTQAHYRAVTLVCLYAVFAFYLRHEFVEEKVFIVPSRDVEIAVLDLVDIPVSGIRHNDNHRAGLAACNQLVCNKFHVSHLDPVGITAVHSVEKVNYRILLVTLVISVRQVDIVLVGEVQRLGIDAVCNDLAGEGRNANAQQHNQ